MARRESAAALARPPEVPQFACCIPSEPPKPARETKALWAEHGESSPLPHNSIILGKHSYRLNPWLCVHSAFMGIPLSKVSVDPVRLIAPDIKREDRKPVNTAPLPSASKSLETHAKKSLEFCRLIHADHYTQNSMRVRQETYPFARMNRLRLRKRNHSRSSLYQGITSGKPLSATTSNPTDDSGQVWTGHHFSDAIRSHHFKSDP